MTDRYHVDVDLSAKTITYGPATTGHYLRARVPTGYVIDFARQERGEDGTITSPLIPRLEPGDLVEGYGERARVIGGGPILVSIVTDDGVQGVWEAEHCTPITRLP